MSTALEVEDLHYRYPDGTVALRRHQDYTLSDAIAGTAPGKSLTLDVADHSLKLTSSTGECMYRLGRLIKAQGMPPRVQKMTSASVPLVEDTASNWRGIFCDLAALSIRSTTAG